MSDVDLEERVRSDLHAALGDGPRPEERWAELDQRLTMRTRRRRRRVVAVAAGVAAVAVGIVALGATRSNGVRVRTVPPPSTVTPVVPSSVTPTTGQSIPDNRRYGQVASAAVGDVTSLVATPDGAWVVDGSGQLLHVDTSGRIVQRRRLPGVTQGPVYLAAGEGSVWALAWSTGSVWRIEPSAGATSGLDVAPQSGSSQGEEAERIAVGAGHVWVTVCCAQAQPNQRLLRIDPSTMKVDAQVALPGDGENTNVVAGAQGVFVTGEGFDTVAQIDPSGTRILHQVTVSDLGATGAGPVALSDTQVFVPGGWSRATSTATHLFTIDPVAGVAQGVGQWPLPVQQMATGSSVVWGLASPRIGSFGPILDLDLQQARFETVPGTDGATAIAASGDTLWYLRDGRLVELRRG